VLQFAGIGEIRPDEGELLVRLPVNGTVLLEERYELATGLIREEKSQVVFTDLRGSTLATASYKPGEKTPPAVRSESVYDPWGRLLERDGTNPDPLHAFVGHEPDPGTGLYQFGARVYDPTLRRWLSPDPLVVALPDLDEQRKSVTEAKLHAIIDNLAKQHGFEGVPNAGQSQQIDWFDFRDPTPY
jgi:RHS repeat-associated protein